MAILYKVRLIKNGRVVFQGSPKECWEYLGINSLTFRFHMLGDGYYNGYSIEYLKQAYIIYENDIPFVRARTLQSLAERSGYTYEYLYRMMKKGQAFGKGKALKVIKEYD